MRTITASVFLAFLLACGGRVDDLTPTATVTPTATSTSTSTPPPSNPPAVDPDCGGMDAIVYESDAHLLSRFDRKAGTATVVGTVSCPFEIDSLAVRHDGTVVVMASTGRTAVIDSARRCNELPYGGGEGLHRGLAIIDDQTLYTLRLGPTSDYVTDGTYHHRLVELGPKGGTLLSTHDTRSYPDFIAATSANEVLVVGLSTRTVDTWATSGSGTSPEPAPGLSAARAGALVARHTLWFVGDVKDAHPSKRVALPSYELDLETSAWTRRDDLTMPGGSISGVRVGMTACAGQR